MSLHKGASWQQMNLVEQRTTNHMRMKVPQAESSETPSHISRAPPPYTRREKATAIRAAQLMRLTVTPANNLRPQKHVPKEKRLRIIVWIGSFYDLCEAPSLLASHRRKLGCAPLVESKSRHSHAALARFLVHVVAGLRVHHVCLLCQPVSDVALIGGGVERSACIPMESPAPSTLLRNLWCDCLDDPTFGPNSHSSGLKRLVKSDELVSTVIVTLFCGDGIVDGFASKPVWEMG